MSSIAMGGIQTVLHLGPGFLTPGTTAIEPEPAPEATAHAAPGPAPAATTFAQDRSPADARTGRLPVWIRPVPPAPVRLAERRTVPEVSNGVLLFDRCVPGCESRDPLLAANHVPAPVADTAPGPGPEAADMTASIPMADPEPAAVLEPVREGEGRIGSLARSGWSWARAVAGAVGETLTP